MRNPIQPSPDRPIPLPDCILMDGWWVDRSDRERSRSDAALRLVIGERDMGNDRRDREHPRD
jgi:hypothetical protein